MQRRFKVPSKSVNRGNNSAIGAPIRREPTKPQPAPSKPATKIQSKPTNSTNTKTTATRQPVQAASQSPMPKTIVKPNSPQKPLQTLGKKKSNKSGISLPGRKKANASAVSTTLSRQKKLDRAQKLSSFKGFFALAQFIIGAIVIALIITNFVFQSFQVIGFSMQPTLQEDDWLIISKVGRSWSNVTGGEYMPDRGEVIVFDDPRVQSSKSIIKRVVALPGETVKVSDGKLFVYNDTNPQGFSPDEDIEGLTRFLTEQSDIPKEGFVVPQGEVFVAGDNRAAGASLDSRNGLGTVPVEKIVGTLWMRLYPINELKKF